LKLNTNGYKANQTVQSLRETIFLKLKTKNPKAAKGKTANDFVLKITGFSDWLLTDSGTFFLFLFFFFFFE